MEDLRQAAQDIIECCGHNNIQRVYCCITRLRLIFENKDQVDYEKLNAHPMVQGIFWSGDECQLIIGLQVMNLSDTMTALLRSHS